jgi:Protein of unknown function (DUF2817)
MSGAAANSHFAQSYAEARTKFLAATAGAGLGVQSHAHPLPGRDGEALAMDVVRQGPTDASALLMISSACHGVEGFCGSGVQVALLHDASWHAAVKASGVAVLYIHALNPHGFSWWRRVTQENVDLNRNFQDFETRPPQRNAAYDQIAAALVPETWPPSADNEAALGAYAAQHGARGFQAAVSGGQYDHAGGLFYGGRAATWSNRTLRQVLREHGAGAARLGWIDVHTGLGPNGHGERIFAGADDAAAIQRARAWWGQDVTSTYDGSSSSAPLTGLMWMATADECPRAEYTGIALEYGTQPQAEVIGALRADQWLQNHPDTPPAQRAQLKRQIRDAFYTDTDAWKTQILEQADAAARQALKGLSGLALA